RHAAQADEQREAGGARLAASDRSARRDRERLSQLSREPCPAGMKILILGLNYAPEPVGIGPYTAGLATYLAENGHDVAVVAGKPYYPYWRVDEGYSGW